jgi:hypothetical protein
MNLNYKIKVKIWKDKKTKMWLVYNKKYNISGYGTSKRKAKESFKYVLKAALEDLTKK